MEMEALLYERMDALKVQCNLCRHRCVIKNGRKGICGVRENRDGVLTSLVYGKLIARHVDPIEKKPLFHVSPGSLSYSVATVGCNFKCRFCQNAEIAQMPTDQGGLVMGDFRRPEQIVAAAKDSGCASIAYTYTEPTVYFELAYETARIAHEAGLLNVFVTNGFMSPEALHLIHPYLDAANVDLKAYSEDFYKTVCSARLEPVKESLILMKRLGIFVEVTTLLIPGLNTEPTELRQLADFLAGSLGTDTPWHISRFHPTYRLLDHSVTPLSDLKNARKIGLEAGLKYVYMGNVPGETGENTACGGCGKRLIDRIGFTVTKNRIQSGNICPACGQRIPGIDLAGGGARP
jgi:pyruvate formate lyase activating enzyme